MYNDITVQDKYGEEVIVPKDAISTYKGYQIAGNGMSKDLIEGGWVAVNTQLFISLIDEVEELKAQLQIQEV